MLNYRFNPYSIKATAGVSPKVIEAARAPGNTNLSNAELFVTPPEHIIESAKKALDEGLTHYILPYQGLIELRQAIANKIKEKNNLHADPRTEILVTLGAGHAIDQSVRAFVSVGDEVILSDPTFVLCRQTVIINGGIPVSVPLKEEENFQLIPEKLEKKITDKTKMIILLNPENPTGTVYTEERLKSIAEIAQRHDLIVLSDEVYEYLVYDGMEHKSIASLPGMKDRTISVFSFSKDFAMAGFRIGYIVTNEVIRNAIGNIQVNDCAHAPSISQIAALAALTGPKDFLIKWRNLFDAARKLTVQELNKIPGVECKMPQGGCYVFPNVSKLGTSEDITVHLAEKAKVGVNPGTMYGESGEGFIRLCYTAVPMNELESSLRRIRDALKELG
jgi:aspartate/methionine/tyrosine aminotransferase